MRRKSGEGLTKKKRSKQEREREIIIEEQETKRRTQKGMAPSPLAIVHLVENRVPHVCFHVGAVIFVETVAGAAVAGTYLKCLTYFKIARELVFVFVGFSGDDLRFGPVYWLSTFPSHLSLSFPHS